MFSDLSKCELMKIPDAAYFMLKDSVINKCDLSGNNIKRIPSKFCTKFTDLTGYLSNCFPQQWSLITLVVLSNVRS
jgi:hypothetical protein